ncbi:transporter substrate-binding domain-containing protein [Thermospira aquatica]|uniref:Transporter substrate-binding domain-containing protein n=1 Tax=Thermospira aquatica TaxID=2828656 RepID=A0AAX3BC81_9SPIR|nr:transporter substrate-binding domain-containing protein [Thermospira aquatica]URA09594.1 transporter substrate-binding domain-containing protein [Thermospira aquatica]
MKKRIWWFLLLGVWLFSCQRVSLTDEERVWIKTHPVIRLAPDPDFPPFEFFDEWGEYQGIGADYVRAFSRWSGVRVEIYHYSNWSEVLQALSNREIDMINCAIDTPSRRVYATFPTPYLRLPNVVVTRRTMTVPRSFEEVLQGRVGMVRSYGMVDILREKYPWFTPRLYPTLLEGLEALVSEEIDYFLSDLGTASYYITEGGFYTLKIVLAFKPDNVSGFGVRSDWPILVSILEKFERSLSEAEKNRIIKRWVIVGHEYIGTNRWWWLVGLLGLGLIGLFGVLLWWLRVFRSREMEHERREGELFRELSEMAEMLPVVLDRLPLAAMMVNQNGVVSYVNQEFVILFGWKKEEISSFYQFYRMAAAQESDRKLLWEKWETIVTGGKPNPYILLDHFLLLDKEEKEHPCRVDIHRLGSTFLFTFVDYSTQEASEKLFQHKQNQMLLAMKEKDLLFMELEHRVRNTLQLMRSFMRLHDSLKTRYTTEDLLLKLTCGVDLLTIIKNYTMQDLKLRLYNLKVPLLEFVQHVRLDMGLDVEADVDPVEMNEQSLLACMFAIEEVFFVVWRCCRGKGKIFLQVRNGEKIVIEIRYEGFLEMTEEELVVSRDFVYQLGGKVHYQFSPVFLFGIALDQEKIAIL